MTREWISKNEGKTNGNENGLRIKLTDRHGSIDHTQTIYNHFVEGFYIVDSELIK